MQQAIKSFHPDEHGDWIATLACAHTQHVRHNPPWQLRPWVQTPEGRSSMIEHPLECHLCDHPQE